MTESESASSKCCNDNAPDCVPRRSIAWGARTVTAGWTLLCCGFAISCISLYRPLIVGPLLAFTPWTLGAAALICALLAAWSAVSRARGLSWSMYATAIVVALVHANAAVNWFRGDELAWSAGYVHPRYGALGWPRTVGHHWRRGEFRVRYQYDELGFRQTPKTTRSSGEVIMLGCSFTFGLGVSDDECYPALLAREWPSVRVRNRAFAAWGTTNACQVLEDWLAEPGSHRAAIYGWIDHHSRRNWRRRSWHRNRGLGPLGVAAPYYELEGDRAVNRGVLTPRDATADDSPQTDEHEARLSVALLRRMAESCRAHGVPFLVLDLSQPQRLPAGGRVLADAEAQGVTVVPIRDAPTDFYPRDGHPRASWHRAVAHTVARDVRLQFLRAR